MTTNPSTTVVDTTHPKNTFSIRVMYRGKKMEINPEQIIRLQANGNYTMIHAEASAPLMTARVLKTYVSPLEFFGFVRVNKTDLVNKNKIARLEDDGRVIMKDEYVSTISRRRKSLFISLLSVIGMLLTVPVMGQNVGIGTTSPTMPLTVRTTDTTAGTPVVSLANGIIDSLYQLNATKGASTGGAGSWMTAIGQAYNGGTLSEALKFYRGTGTNNGSIGITTSGVERVRITNNGAVGIGTSSPDTTAKLDVVGKLKLADGTQATGRFLQSDSTGLASWAQIKTSDFLTKPLSADLSCLKVLGTTPSPGYAISLDVSNGYAYVLDQEGSQIRTFSVADPAVPVQTSNVPVGVLPASIVVASDKAYVVSLVNHTLQVFSLTNPAQPQLIGSANTADSPYDFAVQGNLACVVSFTTDMLQIFDVSILPEPTLLGSIEVSSNPKRVSISGQYAYVGSLDSDGFSVIDISNPSNPSMVFNGYFPDNFCWDLTSRDQYVYELAYDGLVYKLRTISAQNPQTPVIASDLELDFAARSLDRVGNYLVVTGFENNKIAIFNISDSANPVLESEITLSGSPFSIAIEGGIAYIGCVGSDELAVINLACDQTLSVNSISGEAVANSLWLLNGTTIYTDSPKVGIGTTTPVSKLDLEGNVTIGASYAGTNAAPANGAIIEGNVGIGTISPDTMAKLDVIGKVKITDGTQNTGRFLQSDSTGLASWVPISTSAILSEPVTPDFSCLSLMSKTSSPGYPISLNASNSYAYVIGLNSGNLKTYSVADPSSPVETSNISVGGNPGSILVDGDKAYVLCQSTNTLKVLSLTNPAQPQLAGTASTGLSPSDIAVTGTLACVVNFQSATFQIFDVSILPQPALLGSIAVSSFPKHVVVSGQYAYVGYLDNSSFTVINISNPSNPAIVYQSDMLNNNCFDMIGYNQYAFALTIGGSGNNLRTLSLANPLAPEVVSDFPLNFIPRSLDRISHYVIVTSMENNKLAIFDIGDPENPGLTTEMTLSGQPYSIAIEGGLAYVGCVGSNELAIINLGCEQTLSLNSFSGESTAITLWQPSGSNIYTNAPKVGIGTTTPVSKLDLGGNLTIGASYAGTNAAPANGAIIEGNVGIGTATPHALLQLGNTITNRKIVLFESNNNDHEYLGFGINPGMLRYQTANAGDDHVFFSGIDSTGSMELMRITGDGLVGIGTANPASKLDLGGNLAIGSGYAGSFPAPNNGVIIEGKVGIGTSEPVSKLDLGGNVTIGANYAGNNLAPVNGALIEGNVGIGTTTPVSKLDLGGNVTIGSNYAGINAAPANGALIEGNVGIGTTTPVSKLDVEGNLTIGTGYGGSNAAPIDGAIIEGSVGIGTTTPASKLDLEGNLAVGASYAGAFPAPVNGAIIEGNVGIGTIFPHAPLQFGNVASNRKIILSEAENNDHRFRGFGNNPNELRYQVAYPSDNHVFYSGSSSSSSTELLRITGSGEVGIGTSTPHAQLQLGNTLTNRKVVLYESADNDHQYFGLGSNTNMLRYQVAGAADNHAFFSGIDPGTSKELMRITGGGFVGIGTTTPHASLQLANVSANRKIVLSELGNNDHQFMGFGNQADMLRYQVNSNAVSHVFFAGSGAGASNELMRITGFGEVGIGTSTPHALLQLANTTTNRKLVIYESTNNDHQYFGLGNNTNSMRYQVAGATDNHVFYSGINSTSSKELMRITGSGFVGIGTNAPTFPLTVRTSTNTEGAKVASLATAIVDTLFQLNVTRGSTTNGTGAWMTAIGQAYNAGTISEGIKFFRGSSTNDGAMAFTTNNTERIRITSTGTVGVGTSTPVSKLDVTGNLSIGAGYGGSLAAPVNGVIIEGKVGIGTNTPASKLDIEGNLTIGAAYGGTNAAPVNGAIIEGSVGIGTNAPVSKLDVEGNLTIGAGFGGTNAAPANGAIIEGNVGIGTATPNALLQLGNTITNRKIVLYETNNNDHEYLGFGVNGGMLRYQVANVNDNHVFYAGLSSTTSTELMRITGTGRVGIGTSNPQGPLHVAGSSITAPTQDRNYFNVYSGPNLLFNNSSSGSVQIIADGYFWANGGGFVATSDQRIKNIKGLSDTKQDLATLNDIEVTNYTYIDSIQNGNTPQKKVIAQQLQKVYPQAVNTNKGIIPSVFEVASSSQVVDQHTIITTSKAHDFEDGDQVRLILEGKGEKVLNVKVIDEKTFKVEEAIPGRIFVYGKQVDDLLNVDYDAVSMLNVSATQELYKMILELKAENDQLRQDLESRLAKVEARKEGGL